MAINFKGFMKDIKDGVGEVISNKSYVRKSKAKTKEMKGELVDKVSKKEFVKKHGEANYKKSQDSGALLNRNQSKYKKVRKGVEEKYKNLG